MAGALSNRDYQRVVGFLQQLYAQRDLSSFPVWLTRELTELVGVEHATWNEMAFAVPSAVLVEYPRLDGHEQRLRTFIRYLSEHPGAAYFLESGDPSPVAISDFLSRKAFHRLPLYQTLYRDMGHEDQLAFCLSPPSPVTRAVALARQRRGFNARERQICALIRPHLAQAYRNMEALERAGGALGTEDSEWDVAAQAFLEMDRAGCIHTAPERAHRWLERYFDEDRPSTSRAAAPQALVAWARQQVESSTGNDSFARYRPLVRTRGRQRLVARFFPHADDRNAGWVLLEEQTTWHGTEHLRAYGLTNREIEVLLELERGDANQAIAARLGIAQPTVKKHLENAFRKLGVDNRTAAVARLRRAH